MQFTQFKVKLLPLPYTVFSKKVTHKMAHTWHKAKKTREQKKGKLNHYYITYILKIVLMQVTKVLKYWGNSSESNF